MAGTKKYSKPDKPVDKKMYYEVFSVREYEQDGEKKSFWTLIGRAFKNKDDSLSVMLQATPVDGRMQIREPRPKDEE